MNFSNATPFRYRAMVGPRFTHRLHINYTPRFENAEFDDTPFKDEFQSEVYEYARHVFDTSKLASVCDVGCGSGYKLIAQFGDRDKLLGIDLPRTVAHLQHVYPRQEWRAVDLAEGTITGYELAICSDVIEHLENPDVLMRFIGRMKAAKIIISSPERDLLNHGTWDGPPKNLHHVREWNFTQLHAYVSDWFRIDEHFIVNATQIALLSPR